ncbi:MAG: MBL fold metallo-hydrolase [Dehalococcoidia bacterium]|nr:MBL fold metallo-hydrolase [Dehalococcoidia bacterium]
MRITLWGTRGSLPSAGPETTRYGGNTACVTVRDGEGTLLVLDAGTGILRLGASLDPQISQVNVLLTHLHMDHIQGLGFFQPLYEEGIDVHIWGPASATQDLRRRLARYLSPPLFPVPIRDLPCCLTLHDVPRGAFRVGSFDVTADLVCHPGPTVGYRIVEGESSIAYLPDHEPALGSDDGIPQRREWLSGYDLAQGVRLLIHDAQYTPEEYETHVGWGHSSIRHAVAFAEATRAKRLVTFHHDPSHDDAAIDRLVDDVRRARRLPFELIPGIEGATFQL